MDRPQLVDSLKQINSRVRRWALYRETTLALSICECLVNIAHLESVFFN
jgi:hypothetical protein